MATRPTCASFCAQERPHLSRARVTSLDRSLCTWLTMPSGVPGGPKSRISLLGSVEVEGGAISPQSSAAALYSATTSSPSSSSLSLLFPLSPSPPSSPSRLRKGGISFGPSSSIEPFRCSTSLRLLDLPCLPSKSFGDTGMSGTLVRRPAPLAILIGLDLLCPLEAVSLGAALRRSGRPRIIVSFLASARDPRPCFSITVPTFSSSATEFGDTTFSLIRLHWEGANGKGSRPMY
mmetsp:Transcript_27230/g.73589  ORF Transcript_27230/g.73589 Transcript_27230/m.73589 type:complete len:234 (-) Transcript_27230:1484-2185(-)